jgi:hypothetical protein
MLKRVPRLAVLADHARRISHTMSHWFLLAALLPMGCRTPKEEDARRAGITVHGRTAATHVADTGRTGVERVTFGKVTLRVSAARAWRDSSIIGGRPTRPPTILNVAVTISTVAGTRLPSDVRADSILIWRIGEPRAEASPKELHYLATDSTRVYLFMLDADGPGWRVGEWVQVAVHVGGRDGSFWLRAPRARIDLSR